MASIFSKALNGVKVKHCKNTASCQAIAMPITDQVVIPMAQHMGPPCTPTVKLMDLVTVGQKIGDSDAFLTAPIFSSVSGKVTEIRDYVTAQGATCKAVVITTDKEQTVCEDVKPFPVNSHADLVSAAKNCGLVGLGGAGFPTHIKLNPRNLDEVTTLVVNGAECEPYITCDMRLMMDKTAQLVDGICLVKKYMNLDTVIIGVEENKPEAIKILTEAVASIEGISVKTLKALYPQGAEKVLIYECTGKVVQEGKLPSDVGVVVANVATLAKLADFVATGMPIIEKTITVDGSAVAEPKNVTVAIGTKMGDIIAFCGGYKVEPKKILMGGPMMGIVVPNDDYPLVKNNNAILAFAEADATLEEESPCIRCGKCMRACPVNLMPAALDGAYRTKNVDKLKALKVNLCMECGCCSYICPAKRNLAMSNKLAKMLLREQSK